jgi:outer membrane protein OmpA-like peptidoglycan-associated protein
MTTLRKGFLAATILGAAVLPRAGSAQQITGFYIGAGVGYSILQDQFATIDAVVPFAPLKAATVNNTWNGGLGAVGSLGFGAGNGIRLEIEGSYRNNQQNNPKNASTSNLQTGDETKYGVMGNVLYDIDTGLNWIYPYVGAGVGIQFAEWNNVSYGVSGISYLQGTFPVFTGSQTIGRLAYQAIVGLSFPVEYVPGLSVTAEYRYMALSGNRNYAATATFPFGSPPLTTKIHVSDDQNHTFLLGVRYAFNVEPETEPAAAAPVPPQPVPTAGATRTYIVFFDWDRADLTPRARDIVAEAVRASARIAHTRIEVAGNADRTGTESYNQALSLRRAEAVAEEMQRWGVPRSVIDIRAYGDTRPLVPTAAGVREPQNRRVEIVYR